MPSIDVSRVLSDPCFADTTLVCFRGAQTVGNDGRATNVTTACRFVGVVTIARGNDLRRGAEGSYIEGSILVHTPFVLLAGTSGVDADKVQWKGRVFTVSSVADYSSYGAGFTVATCEPLALSGS